MAWLHGIITSAETIHIHVLATLADVSEGNEIQSERICATGATGTFEFFSQTLTDAAIPENYRESKYTLGN